MHDASRLAIPPPIPIFKAFKALLSWVPTKVRTDACANSSIAAAAYLSRWLRSALKRSLPGMALDWKRPGKAIQRLSFPLFSVFSF